MSAAALQQSLRQIKQRISMAILACKPTVLTEQLAAAADEARRRGYLAKDEYDEPVKQPAGS